MIAADKISTNFSIFQAEVNLGSSEFSLRCNSLEPKLTSAWQMLKLVLILSLLKDSMLSEAIVLDRLDRSSVG